MVHGHCGPLLYRSLSIPIECSSKIEKDSKYSIKFKTLRKENYLGEKLKNPVNEKYFQDKKKIEIGDQLDRCMFKERENP